MATLRDVVRRSARITALARGVRGAVLGGPLEPSRPSNAPLPGLDGVDELLKVTPKRSPAGEGPRLNLLIPTLSPRRVFGGARTALDLFDELGPAFPRLRVVSFTSVADAAIEALDGFSLGSPADERTPARVVVAAPTGTRTTLAVEAEDVFLATFWSTAELAIRLVRWQATTFGAAPRPFAYLIQDYEPGFYPWSAQFELARSTYGSGVPTIAVVNTSLLAEFLDREGFAFPRLFTFEPRLDPRVRAAMSEPAVPRRRRIVVYGRPGTPRNAFPLIVDGLRAWVAHGSAGGWEVVSAGEPHRPVELGRGLTMGRLGKLPPDAYGRLLRESAVGLSLMVSPHPSYPPLDMAHAGMRVVTNRFGPKDLSTWHENIVSVGSLTADALGDALLAATKAFEADPTGGDRGRPLRPEYLADGPLFPFVDELAVELLGGTTPRAPA